MALGARVHIAPEVKLPTVVLTKVTVPDGLEGTPPPTSAIVAWQADARFSTKEGLQETLAVVARAGTGVGVGDAVGVGVTVGTGVGEAEGCGVGAGEQANPRNGFRARRSDKLIVPSPLRSYRAWYGGFGLVPPNTALY
jgi:hypothetical protein